MKKNRMMRIASCLLVLVLLTTCVISGTFAKYVTSDDAHDSATVAKWGITLSVTGDDATYDDDKSTNDVAAKVHTNALLAPGTYKKLADVELEGTPEVAYEIIVDVDLNLQNWGSGIVDDPSTTNKDESVYCPVVFIVDAVEIKIDTTNKTTEELEAAIEKAIMIAIAGGDASTATTSLIYTDGKHYTQTFNANIAVPATAEEIAIECYWAFDGDDVLDTVLGNAATKATIGFDLSITVNQVD